jgi:hypothetical protein
MRPLLALADATVVSLPPATVIAPSAVIAPVWIVCVPVALTEPALAARFPADTVWPDIEIPDAV